jgi:hypothetical protein
MDPMPEIVGLFLCALAMFVLIWVVARKSVRPIKPKTAVQDIHHRRCLFCLYSWGDVEITTCPNCGVNL